MPRIEPAAVGGPLITRVMGRRPPIMNAFLALDDAFRTRPLLSARLKETVRRSTAAQIGCDYCASLGEPRTEFADERERLAVELAQQIQISPRDVDDEFFADLQGEFSDEEIVELLAWICLVVLGGQMFGSVLRLEATSEQAALKYQAWVGSGDAE